MVAILTTSALCLAGATAASARTTVTSSAELVVNGNPLGLSALSSTTFTVTALAPTGSKVKFKLDGVYLGQDSVAPYSWLINTTAGQHKIDARWEVLGDRYEINVEFTVSGQSSATPPAPPSQTPPPPAAPSSSSHTLPPPPPPATTPPKSSAHTIAVSTATELSAALASARPGQTISLADGLYIGKFVGAASGTASSAITLVGSHNAVLSTGNIRSGYGLHVTGSYWRLEGFSVAKSAKGIVLDGSQHTTVRNVDVGEIGAEGVHFRQSSSDGVIETSSIHDTGLDKPAYGEGIYIGSAKSNWSKIMGLRTTPDSSNRVKIIGNMVTNTSAEGIDVKEGTVGGSIIGNTFHHAGYSGQNYADSWVDLKGNGYTISGNSGSGTLRDAFQVHSVIKGWGQYNYFSGNTVTEGVPGYEVWIQSARLVDTVICEPSMAGKGLSNTPCID